MFAASIEIPVELVVAFVVVLGGGVGFAIKQLVMMNGLVATTTEITALIKNVENTVNHGRMERVETAVHGCQLSLVKVDAQLGELGRQVTGVRNDQSRIAALATSLQARVGTLEGSG
jgi:hypothetical protein